MKDFLPKNEKFVFLLFVLLSSFLWNVGKVDAQTLKTDGAVPTLNACGANGTFTVTIAKGGAACPAGTLQVQFPATGFEYQPGSAKIVGGAALAETNVTANGATFTLPNIPAGTPAELITITYEAKATCEAIPLAALPDDQKPVVTYTLNGCTATPQTGQSDIININFAVLKVEVTPSASQGVIGSIITRIVKVTNTGNGSIGSFTVDRTLGASLSITGVTQPTVSLWTVDASVPNKYVYSGATLLPGASVQFTENVQINACTDMQTTFDAYYGCTGKCILGNANGTITAGISIDQSIQPKLQVTVTSTPTITCLNQEYEHVWTIKNNGTGTSSATKLFLRLDGSILHAGSYFNENSIIVGVTPVAINIADTLHVHAAGGDAFGTTGKINQLSFNIPDLAPGESKVIHFKQYYAAPVADCTKNLSSFIRTYTAYDGIYKHKNGCNAAGTNPDIVLPFAQVGNYVTYGFSGTNIGEVDITDSYNADFLIKNWNVEIADIGLGAYFDIILNLSPSIQAGFDMSAIKLFDPVANKYLAPGITSLGSGKYQLRITYGTPDWPGGANLNSSSYHLQFPVTMTCNAGGGDTPASYTVTGQLNNGGACSQLLQFACQTVTLNTHCGISCPSGGLQNGAAVLKRMTYGQVAPNPDNATPDLSAPVVDPNNLPTNFATRYFVGTDTLQISQTGTVVDGSATPTSTGGWSAGTFSVSSPANLASVAVPNTGKVTITRSGTVYTVSGLAINTSIANTFSIDLSVANLLTGTGANMLPVLPDSAGFTYENNDVIVSSLEIQPMELYNNTVAGLQEFPTTYNLSIGNVGYSCGGNFRATGYYGPTWFQFIGGNGPGTPFSLTSCTPKAIDGSSPSFLFLFREEGYWRNALFPNEFRQLATPKKAIFNVPAGLELVSLRVDINNNSTTGNLNKTIPVSVTNGSYTLDVEQVIKDLKGGGTNAYLDEGFEIRIYPSVVPTCKSTGTDAMTVEGTMAGTFWNRSSNFVVNQYRNSPEISLGISLPFIYKTDNNLLSATVSHPNVNATTNQAKWVVQVTNSSSFRAFDNVWMGQSAAPGVANIVSVLPVVDLNGTPAPGAVAVTAVGGVYQLGPFGISAAGNKYYLVTADYTGCDPGSITLAYGADCSAYPANVASAACSKTLIPLNYTPVFANLQTSVINQNTGDARPKICDQLPYEIEINNAGLGDATALKIKVPLTSAGGLMYVSGSLQIQAPGAGYVAGSDASVVTTNDAIEITIPAATVPALKNGERFRIIFKLSPQGCSFTSGQRISFVPSGKNVCGSDISTISPASSNRVTINGAPTDEPVLGIVLSSVVVNPAQAGNNLSAKYNLTIKNIGDGGNNYPATTAYSFYIKLPDEWEIDGNPQDLVSTADAVYTGTLDAAKGYIFKLAKDLTVNNEIKIIDAKLIYTKPDAASLACGYSFAPIHEAVYTSFTPTSCVAGAPAVCSIEQVTVENQTTAITLTKPAAPIGAANQSFCVTNAPKISDIALTGVGVAVWYGDSARGAVLTSGTLLTDGATYYVANKLIDGGICESDLLAVKVKIDAQPTATAGTDQTIYTTGQFTMAGNVPTAGMTGLWTEVIPVGGTAAATITSPANYNTTVTIGAGKTATLRWTMTNGACTATDDVVLAYVLKSDLAVSKTADKTTVAAGETLAYTIKITNNGPSSLLANDLITLTETLPAELTDVTYVATGGVYDAVAHTFKLDAAMSATQSVSLTINGTVAADYQGTSIVNKVSIVAPAAITDPDPSNDDAEITTPVTRAADLAAQKIADKTSVVAGDALTYTITLTNNGPSTLLAGEAIGVTETLPAGFTGLTYASTGGVYDAAAGTFILDAAMATDQAVSFTITGKVTEDYSLSNIVNSVTVTPPTGVTDPDPVNNDAEVTTPVTRAADLTVLKIADKTSVVAGDGLKYTITITNNGLSTLFAGETIGVTETLPAGFNGLTYASTGGVYDAAANTFKLDAAMATGQSVSFTISGTVSADYNTANIINKVNVSPPTGVTDPVPGNNTATVTTPVTRTADLAVLKTADKASVVAGEDLVYTIKITNNGISALLAGEAIKVTESLPAGFNNLAYASTDGTYSAGAGSFTLGSAMAVGQTVSFTITGTVAANYSLSDIANTVTVAPPAGITDPDPSNNDAEVTTQVTRAADLAAQKTADKTTVVAGDALTYTITLTNNGPSTLLAGEAIGVTETLPSGFNGLTYASTGGVYDATAGTFILDAAMATGQAVSFTITGKVTEDYSLSNIVNSVTVTPPTGVTDPDPGNNDAAVTTTVTRAADLTVLKIADKTSVVAGDALKYTITITNNGLSTLFAGETIGVTETLPAGFNGLTYASTGGVYDAAANTFKLDAAMASGQSVSFTINGTVSAAYSTASIVNTVSVTPPAGVTDPVPGNNNSTVTTLVTRTADLAVLKTADKALVTAGEDLVYTIKITNNGISTLLAGEAIKVTESLPAGFNNLAYASTDGTYSAGASTFTLGSAMAAGETVSFTITGTVVANYSLTNIANTVTVAPPASVTDPVAGNNTSTVTTPVTRVADLGVVKTVDKATVVAGDALTYTIAITNNGPSALLANDVIKVTEGLPAGFNNLSYTSTGGAYSAAGGTFTLSSAMATGQTVSFTITGTVAANYNSNNIANTVTIAPPAGVTDPVSGNNTTTVTTPVTRLADLSIVKTANKTTVVAGEPLSYTLTVTNNGQSTLLANEVIQVVETLPAALTNVTITSTQGTYNNGAFKLAADLAKGGSVVITVTGTVSSATLSGATLTNVAAVTVPTGVTDPVSGNNTDDESTPVTRVADLSVVKTASSMTPVVGTNLTFTIKVKNNGPSDASQVSVTDLLESGYKYVSSATNTGAFAEATGVWTVGNLTKGTEVTLAITVKVLGTGNYVNTATVTGNENDPDLTNNTSTVTPVPAPSPPVAIDDAAATKANDSVLMPVLDNNHPGLSDSPLVPSTLEIITNPSNGTVKVNPDGTVIYTPNHGFIGVDNFRYRVQDALGYWSNVATATVIITSNELKIPNVFTPNGDGKNDTFEIFGIEGYDNASITIFNRWGNEVYRNTLYQNNWDGNGLNEGTYYYLIKLKKNGKEELYKGWVLLKH